MQLNFKTIITTLQDRGKLQKIFRVPTMMPKPQICDNSSWLKKKINIIAYKIWETGGDEMFQTFLYN